MAVSSKELMKDTIIGLKRAMDITTRLSSWAENDMKAEDIALSAKNEIERLREALEKIAAIDEIAVTDFDRKRHLWNFQKIARSALQQKDTE